MAKLPRFYDKCKCGVPVENCQATDEKGRPYCAVCWQKLEDKRRKAAHENEAAGQTVLTSDVLSGSCSTCARTRALCGVSEKVKCSIWTPSESKIAEMLLKHEQKS